eukprot:m.67078 g.67078  ORF g.67078 m.67078 type:complete len:1084 (-) comp14089_c0_seq1:175-3426(-)
MLMDMCGWGKKRERGNGGQGHHSLLSNSEWGRGERFRLPSDGQLPLNVLDNALQDIRHRQRQLCRELQIVRLVQEVAGNVQVDIGVVAQVVDRRGAQGDALQAEDDLLRLDEGGQQGVGGSLSQVDQAGQVVLGRDEGAAGRGGGVQREDGRVEGRVDAVADTLDPAQRLQGSRLRGDGSLVHGQGGVVGVDGRLLPGVAGLAREVVPVGARLHGLLVGGNRGLDALHIALRVLQSHNVGGDARGRLLLRLGNLRLQLADLLVVLRHLGLVGRLPVGQRLLRAVQVAVRRRLELLQERGHLLPNVLQRLRVDLRIHGEVDRLAGLGKLRGRQVEEHVEDRLHLPEEGDKDAAGRDVEGKARVHDAEEAGLGREGEGVGGGVRGDGQAGLEGQGLAAAAGGLQAGDAEDVGQAEGLDGHLGLDVVELQQDGGAAGERPQVEAGNLQVKAGRHGHAVEGDGLQAGVGLDADAGQRHVGQGVGQRAVHAVLRQRLAHLQQAEALQRALDRHVHAGRVDQHVGLARVAVHRDAAAQANLRGHAGVGDAELDVGRQQGDLRPAKGRGPGVLHLRLHVEGSRAKGKGALEVDRVGRRRLAAQAELHGAGQTHVKGLRHARQVHIERGAGDAQRAGDGPVHIDDGGQVQVLRVEGKGGLDLQRLDAGPLAQDGELRAGQRQRAVDGHAVDRLDGGRLAGQLEGHGRGGQHDAAVGQARQRLQGRPGIGDGRQAEAGANLHAKGKDPAAGRRTRLVEVQLHAERLRQAKDARAGGRDDQVEGRRRVERQLDVVDGLRSHLTERRQGGGRVHAAHERGQRAGGGGRRGQLQLEACGRGAKGGRGRKGHAGNGRGASQRAAQHRGGGRVGQVERDRGQRDAGAADGHVQAAGHVAGDGIVAVARVRDRGLHRQVGQVAAHGDADRCLQRDERRGRRLHGADGLLHGHAGGERQVGRQADHDLVVGRGGGLQAEGAGGRQLLGLASPQLGLGQDVGQRVERQLGNDVDAVAHRHLLEHGAGAAGGRAEGEGRGQVGHHDLARGEGQVVHLRHAGHNARELKGHQAQAQAVAPDAGGSLQKDHVELYIVGLVDGD